MLVIGNKNYSSWSLRAWLALKKSGVEFEERKLALDTPGFQEEIADLSPTRRVPALWHDGVCIWDSLAIAETVNERFADHSLWPAEPGQRALARAVSAEMHSGFNALRQCMPMNCRARNRELDFEPALEAEIERVFSIWAQCRQARSESGDWLFGRFSIADAMYVPVALRFHAYSVKLPEVASNYMDAVLQDPDVSDWMQTGAAEPEIVAADEAGKGGE